MKKYMTFLLLCFILLTSCSVGASNSRQEISPEPARLASSTENPAPSDSEKQAIIPTNTQLPTNTESPTQTPLPTIAPTQTPTKTELVPALNGTPMPIADEEIKKENILELKVIKQTSSKNPIVLIGAEGSRWYVQHENEIEIHDTKTNKLIWKTELAKNSNILNQEGNIIFKLDGNVAQILSETGESREFRIPEIEGKDKGSVRTIVNFKKELIAIGVVTPFYYAGPPIPMKVFKWGESDPLFTFIGNSFGFSLNGEYLTYVSGKNIELVNPETGKVITEFGLRNENAKVKTSWNDQYLAISRQSTIEIWQLSDRKMIRVLQEKSEKDGQAFEFKFSQDGQFILLLQPGKTLHSWSIKSGELINEEKTIDTSLNHLAVSNNGEIIRFNLPDVQGSSWILGFNDLSVLSFSKDRNSLVFSNKGTNGGRNTEECEWDLLTSPACEYKVDTPNNYQIRSLGNDYERYSLKSRAEPVSLFKGWEKDGEYIAQIPKISIGQFDYIRDFKYDSTSGLILVDYSNGKTLIINHKSNTRLLIEDKDKRFLISKDGQNFFELANQKKNPILIEFVQYDSMTLKEVTRIPLEKTIHPLVQDKTLEDLTPQLSSMVLSPDGKSIYANINYFSKTKKDEDHKAFFLGIPLDAADKYSLVELDLISGQTSNMVITDQGNLAFMAKTQTGDLHFIDTATGKILHTLHVGGSPIKLAMKPDGKLLAVADTKSGIQLLGIPGD